MMKAFIKSAAGIEFRDIPVPTPKETEVLVKVRASSLNRADLSLVDGKAHGAHGGPGTVLGLEWSGDVVAVGSQVEKYQVGDRIMCSGIGAFAEYACADWRRCFPLPTEDTSYENAACLPVALRTAHTALTELAQLQPGQSIAIIGASSGVGLMCLQVAKVLGARLVIGTSTNPSRSARLPDFGADLVLNTKDADWAAQVQAATDGGVDALIDFLAGPLINDSMRALKIGGRMVNVGRMAGETGTFDFDLHSLRRIQYFGMTFRTRSVENVGEIAQRVEKDLWQALRNGELSLPIDRTLPLEKTGEALEAMRRNEHLGKIIIAQPA